MIKAFVEKCPECRKENQGGAWVMAETKVTTSKYCPNCKIKKMIEFDEFMKILEEPK